MVTRKSMFGNILTFFTDLNVSDVFFFSCCETSASFSNVVPGALSTGDLVDYISLEINSWSTFWRRKLLLRVLRGLVNTRIPFFQSDLASGSVRPFI